MKIVKKMRNSNQLTIAHGLARPAVERDDVARDAVAHQDASGRWRQRLRKPQNGGRQQCISLQHQESMDRHGLTQIRCCRTIDQPSRHAAGHHMPERHRHASKLTHLSPGWAGLQHCSGFWLLGCEA